MLLQKLVSPLATPLALRTALIRRITTSADTTQLQQEAPSDPSTPFTVRLHHDSFQAHQCQPPDLDVSVTKELLLTMYKQMQTVRRMEMSADALYKAKLIRGFCHLATGQVLLLSLLLFLPLTIFSTGSCLRRPRAWNPRTGPCHHRIPLSSFRRPTRRFNHRRHRRAPWPPNRHVPW